MIKKLDHIAMVVRDLDDALAVYSDLFGLKASVIETIPDQGAKAALIPLGNADIELLEPIDDSSAIARSLERRGEGFHHICFEVDDVDRELKSLAAKGAQLIDQQARTGLAGRIGFVHPRAAKGVLIELAQKADTQEEAPAHQANRVKKICNVGIGVKNIEDALGVYADLFALRPEAEVVEHPDVGLRLSLLPVGDSLLELMQPIANTGGSFGIAMTRFIEKRGEGLYYLALGVDNVNKELRRLAEKGVDLIDKEVKADVPVKLGMLHPKATKGALIAFMQETWERQ